MKIVGILLIAAGALALYFRGIPYTHQEKVVDLGPIQATAQKTDTIPLPPWLGGGLILIGAAGLVMPGGRRR